MCVAKDDNLPANPVAVNGPVVYLDPGERLDDPDEVLLQQVVVQFGQVGADDGVIPQLRLVVCKGLEVSEGRRWTLTTRQRNKTVATPGVEPRPPTFSKSASDRFLLASATHFSESVCRGEAERRFQNEAKASCTTQFYGVLIDVNFPMSY